MKYAIGLGKDKIVAAPGLEGFCPLCNERLVARCGEIKVWHWAHEATSECDPWWEPETDWHRSWKSFVSTDRVEVAYGEHRADILGQDETVVELQHSLIDPAQIRAREAFYGKMVWLIDGSTFLGNLRVEMKESSCDFVWAHARPSWFGARKPRFIHGFSVGQHVRTQVPGERRPRRIWKPSGESTNIFQILTLKVGRKIEGTGRIIEFDRFVKKLLVGSTSLEVEDPSP